MEVAHDPDGIFCYDIDTDGQISSGIKHKFKRSKNKVKLQINPNQELLWYKTNSQWQSLQASTQKMLAIELQKHTQKKRD